MAAVRSDRDYWGALEDIARATELSENNYIVDLSEDPAKIATKLRTYRDTLTKDREHEAPADGAA